MAEVGSRTKLKVNGLTPRAADQLQRWGWPGNVRELQNVIERAVVLAQGSRVDLEDLPEDVRSAIPGRGAPGEGRTLAAVERDYILGILDSVGGNKARAASELDIGTATLFRKLKQFGRGVVGSRTVAPARVGRNRSGRRVRRSG